MDVTKIENGGETNIPFRYTVIWNKVIDEHLSLCYRYQNYKVRYKF